MFVGVDPPLIGTDLTDVISRFPTALRQHSDSTPTVALWSVSMSAETRVPGAASLERERSICLPPLWGVGVTAWFLIASSA